MGPLVASSDEERAARQRHLQYAEADFEPLPFDARPPGRSVRWLRTFAERDASRPGRTFDAMIAAIAAAAGLPVCTCNPRDFEGVHDLEIIAMAHPDS
ncbi:MAG: PIN domain-containing protein [Nocardioidaceae bacterium]